MKLFANRVYFYPVPLRLGVFILILLLCWLPLAIPIYLLFASDPNLTTIITMGLLFVIFLFLVKLWGKSVYRDAHIFQHYGLTWQRKSALYLLKGLSIGFCFTWSLFLWEAILGLVTLQIPLVEDLLIIILPGLLSAFGVAFAEELLFRGWLLAELQRDYSAKMSLWLNALIFAVLHFLKPWSEIIRTFPQFPGLLLLGLILVLAKRNHHNSLSISIGLHAGLVWAYYIINVGKLVKYNPNIPSWLIGVDGNPLAGLMGLLFLLALIPIINNYSKVGS